LLGRLFGSGTPQPSEEELAAAAEAAEARRREEEAVAARLSMLTDVWGLEHASDLLVFLEEGLINDLNEAAIRAYGYTRGDLFGRLILDLFAPEYRDECRAILDRRERVTRFYPTVNIRRNGQTFPAEVSFRSTIFAGNRVALAVIHDLSERAEAELKLKGVQRQANEAAHFKAEFVTKVQHEVLTPMHALLGMTELLLATQLSEEQREYASSAHAAGENLLHSMGQLLTVSDAQASEIKVANVDFDLAECVEASVAAALPAAQSKQLVLLPFIDPQIPARLIGDPVLIAQVVANLVDNALKFTAQGSVRVSVTLEKDDTDRVNIRFGVKDTGIGISPEVQRGLFEAGAPTRGLGLCKHLTDLMGGYIGVTSEPDAGSTFWFRLTLPVNMREHAPRRVLPETRILVVDPQEFARSITIRYLSAWGARVEEAASARDALHMLHRGIDDGNPYRIVVMDYDMPDQDSFSVAKAIKNDPTLASTQLIMTAAFDVPGRGQRAIESAVAAYMVRPLRAQRLFTCVASLIKDDDAGAAPRPAAPRAVLSGGAGDKRYHVLLVEDNAVNVRLATKQLETLGCTVSVAENGAVAVETLREQSFDLVLMDLEMPVMGGLAATKQIRTDELRTGTHAKIVAMTAAARPEDRAACLAAEMDDYLSKPVRLDALRSTLERWISPR
jgi:PAS domain S-box-containing protein